MNGFYKKIEISMMKATISKFLSIKCHNSDAKLFLPIYKIDKIEKDFKDWK